MWISWRLEAVSSVMLMDRRRSSRIGPCFKEVDLLSGDWALVGAASKPRESKTKTSTRMVDTRSGCCLARRHITLFHVYYFVSVLRHLEAIGVSGAAGNHDFNQ